jgi:hypothetical protein
MMQKYNVRMLACVQTNRKCETQTRWLAGLQSSSFCMHAHMQIPTLACCTYSHLLYGTEPQLPRRYNNATNTADTPEADQRPGCMAH